MKALLISLFSGLFLIGQLLLVCGSEPRVRTPVPAAARSFHQAVQSEAISKGKLVENVVGGAQPEQSYSLYVPAKYTPERKWPVLYAFDPAARGQIPVERFRAAAEEYGWILAGSNNSRNGPNKLATDAFEAMWQDTHSRFSIDDRRVYAAGFSGGARAAVGLAFRCRGCITGVIASGAGFHSQVPVSSNLPFVYFAAVGVDDFNFPELKDLEKKLQKVGTTQRLAVFPGDHEWLPPELALEAIQWMELQAMKVGRRDKDAALIESLWQTRLDAARISENAGNQYEAYRRYQAISGEFAGLKDVVVASEKASLLSGMRDVKRSIREEKDEIDKQSVLLNRIDGLLSQRSDLENGLTATSEFRAAISTLVKQSKELQDSSQRRVARRVLRSLFIGAYEQADSRFRAEDYAGAISQFEIAAEIAPDNARIFFALACAQARAGQKGRALQSLRKSLDKGFKDLESITTNRALDSLRGETVYIELVNSLKKKP